MLSSKYTPGSTLSFLQHFRLFRCPRPSILSKSKANHTAFKSSILFDEEEQADELLTQIAEHVNLQAAA
jgi:hypothetical protein